MKGHLVHDVKICPLPTDDVSFTLSKGAALPLLHAYHDGVGDFHNKEGSKLHWARGIAVQFTACMSLR